MQALKNYSRLVKFEHTVFALPFALTGFFLAVTRSGSPFRWSLLFLVLLCMIFARNAAMGFNRYLDREIDKRNPRTNKREIPAGILIPRNVLFFVVTNGLLFIATTWFINPLCFYLSPVALFIVLFYSYTKRFTAWCHFVLSLGLAIAPVGAYLAVTGTPAMAPVWISAIVFFWVSGFDILYSLQDESFDKENRIQSIPSHLGIRKALIFSIFLHVLTALFVVIFGVVIKGGWIHWTGAAIFITLLVYQHSLVKPGNLKKINLAFSTTNGIASILYGALVILDLLIN
jgi:4-hydroxybenzoate polyprenyltransferase